MKIIQFIFQLSICGIIIGCSPEYDLWRELKEHYQDDALKKKAARFLLDYMPYHYTYNTQEYCRYCQMIDSVWSSGAPIDSMMSASMLISQRYSDSLSLIFDSKLVDANYLIWNIDKSFDIWESSPYLKHLSFDDFCEYVLPYKCFDGQPINKWKEDWKGLFLGDLPITSQLDCFNINARKAAEALTYPYRSNFLAGPRNVEGFNIIPIFDLSTGFKRPYDSCIDNARLGLLNCRSKGVPVSLDYIPNWAYTSGRHYWNSVYATRRRNENYEPFRVKPGDKHFRDNPMAKVYRITYRPNPKYLNILKTGHKLPANLELCSQDVSAEYTRVSDITITIPLNYSARLLSLSVFDNRIWVPVDVSISGIGRVSFKQVGVGVLYAITAEIGGEERPVVDPFILDLRGNVQTFLASESETIDITLTRKYPSFSHIFNSHKYMHGGRVEASNNPDFATIEIEASFPSDSIFSCSICVPDTVACRYWRVVPSCSSETDIAELFFYDNQSIELFPISFAPELFDRDALTFKAITSQNIATLDFGKRINITKISCIRRGDGNDIIPGDVYELYCWQYNDWQLIERKTSMDIKIHFAGVPSKGLYFIKDITQGSQNRTFIWNEQTKRPEWY